MSKAMVLFSGGMDSAVCLAWALDKFDHVEAIGFDYGQRQSVELQIRSKALAAITLIKPEWRVKIKNDQLVNLRFLKDISPSALTRHDMEIEPGRDGLPTTFTLGRNIFFFTSAAAAALPRGITTLIGGMCETDYGGYPDCRPEFMASMAATLSYGMQADFSIVTPLMHVSKTATWRMAQEIGGEALVDVIIRRTHTCYQGDHHTMHDWGYGCGGCPACDLRSAGYIAFRTESKA